MERHELPLPQEISLGVRSDSGRVHIQIDASYAASPAAQHFAWMVLNQLLRLKGVVRRVTLEFPRDVAVASPSIIPFSEKHEASLAFTEAAHAVARDCEFEIGPADSPEVVIAFGAARLSVLSSHTIYASARRWAGAISNDATRIIPVDTADHNPVGPHVAATLAVAEAWKQLMGMPSDSDDWVKEKALNLATRRSTSATDSTLLDDAHNPPWEPLAIDIIHVVGAGAVGNAVMHTLYTSSGLSGLIALVDLEPIDDTNLNRYLLAIKSDCETEKASAIARRFIGRSNLRVIPRNDGWQGIRARTQLTEGDPNDLQRVRDAEASERFPTIVSCVDKNKDRHAIQAVLPHRLIQGSTPGLAIQARDLVLTTNADACAACFSPAETDIPDEHLKQRFRRLSADARESEAAQLGISLAKIESWIEGDCTALDAKALTNFRRAQDIREWSAPFPAALAGLFLAAAILRPNARRSGSGITHYHFTGGLLLDQPARSELTCTCQTTSMRDAYRSIWQNRSSPIPLQGHARGGET